MKSFEPAADAAAHLARARRFAQQHQYDAALASYRAALQIDASAADVFVEVGFVFIRLGRYDMAAEAFAAAADRRPDDADALRGRAQCLFVLGRVEEAVGAYDRLLAVAPDLDYMAGERFHAQLHCCDWRDYERRRFDIAERVRRGQRADIPGAFMCHNDDPSLQRRCAEKYAADVCAVPLPVARPAHFESGRVRVAYLSGDFGAHATAYLAAGLFEHHDRSRFEIFGFSYGINDGSAMRARLERSFDVFFDVAALPDEDIAARIRGLGVDIAVDMKGFTLGGRPRILATRPAPIQIAYLAYPGTMGTSFLDYIVADRHVIPFEDRAHYAENVIYLPGSYQVNDSGRTAAERPSRRDAGLPDDAFVYSCFNSLYKITPPVFDAWLQVLRSVPASVLWLIEGNATAMRNLRNAAVAGGIGAERLIFAPKLAAPQHWARIANADVMLDTFPVNAHTTASDALWAGVPVVTIAGSSFTSRVATSLLHAAGLPQLSVPSIGAYTGLATRLGTDPGEFRRTKKAVANAHANSSLFDTALFVRRLEAAYIEVRERSLRGEPPATVTID